MGGEQRNVEFGRWQGSRWKGSCFFTPGRRQQNGACNIRDGALHLLVPLNLALNLWADVRSKLGGHSFYPQPALYT